MNNHSITENFIRYYPEKINFNKSFNRSEIQDGFVLKIRLKENPSNRQEKVVLKIDGFLEISLRLLKQEEDSQNLSGYDRGEQFFVYADQNGYSPIICAKLYLNNEYNPERNCIKISLPLNLFDAVNNELYLFYDGVRFCWIYGGKIVNCNFPFGDTKAGEFEVLSENFADFGFCTDIKSMKTSEEKEVTNRSIAYYSSSGYNDWAGDIVNFWHNGIYHLLVLYDRHHHGNRFGEGAHTTIHLTTKDFKNWENHGEVYSLKNPWETFGTGTMFYHNGKYYYTFGFHTSRVIPDEKTAGHLLKKYYEENKETRAFSYKEIFEKGYFPNGSNYLVSDDGINFTPSEKQVHWAENPSVYTNADGTLTMYAGYGADGTWQADNIDGPWKRVDSAFPNSEMRKSSGCSTECPSMFSWNGYKYLLMGFTGFFKTEKNGNEFIDMVPIGMDIYDGLCVPMVANCNGRYILSGWLNGYGWAYVIAHRELVQKQNGILGIRWMPEHTPEKREEKLYCSFANADNGLEIDLQKRTSYYIECKILPKSCGRVGIAFSGEGKPFVFSLNTKNLKVQANYSEDTLAFPDELPSISEYITENGAINNFKNLSGEVWHKDSVNFSIVNVEEIKGEYTFKMILHYEPKTEAIVLDAEIGGGRTFISNRRGFIPEKLTVLTENATVQNLKIYTI